MQLDAFAGRFIQTILEILKKATKCKINTQKRRCLRKIFDNTSFSFYYFSFLNEKNEDMFFYKSCGRGCDYKKVKLRSIN